MATGRKQRGSVLFQQEGRASARLASLKAISHENFPAIHRAFLFFVWEMCEVVGIEYTDRVASAFSRLCNVAEAALTPHMSAEDRKHNAYFNRRAPGALVAIESPEALVFAQASS